MTAPVFFAGAEEFRAWLLENHDTAQELLVGYWKKATGKPSVTWEETVDEALCVGWIDGVRRSLGDESYTVRFTPRRPASIWSKRNLGRVDALRAEGRMAPEGLRAWEARRLDRAGYTYEPKQAEFPEDMQRQFGDSWEFHCAQPPGYRNSIADWVLSAKQDATQQRRLRAVVAAARKGERVNLVRPFDVLDE